MGRQIKLSKTDLSKVGTTAVKLCRTSANYVRNHPKERFAGAFSVLTIDDIRLRISRHLERKKQTEKDIQTQQILRKNEAKINALKDEADQAREAVKKVDQLVKIVQNLTEDGASE